MFNDISTPLSLLQSRRSGKPRDLIAPGPDAAQMRTILEVALRTPDHGKLAPWRFVIVRDDQRDALATLLERAYRDEKPDAGKLEIEALHQFARQAPALVVALFTPRPSKIPLWEQELSTGAAIMNLLHATHASGFAGSWLTGWATYNDAVRNAFGGPDDRIAGFLFLGTPGKPLEERLRPEYDTIVLDWDI